MTQENQILSMLKKAGPVGINSFGEARKVALQLPARILALKRQGHVIVTRRYKSGPLKRSTTYILVGSPKQQPVITPPRTIVDYDYRPDGVAVPVYAGEEQRRLL